MEWLAVVPKLTSSLSLAGSGWIVGEVLFNDQKRNFVYHRLLLGMAFYDILVSLWYFASTWPIPSPTTSLYTGTEDGDFIIGAIGSDASCRAQGFFLQLGLANAVYFAMLGTYYTFVISYSYTDDRLKNDRWELSFHLIPLCLGIGTSVAALVLDLYHDAGVWCWIAASPEWSCDNNNNEADDDLCRNSTEVPIYRWAFSYAPAWISFGVVVATMVQVYRGVRYQELRMKRYAHRHATCKKESSGGRRRRRSRSGKPRGCGVADGDETEGKFCNSESSIAASVSSNTAAKAIKRRMGKLKRHWRHLPRTRQFMTQALCFMGAFVLSNLFSVVARDYHHRHEEPSFILTLLQVAFEPMQGFLVFLAYRRPTYLRLRKQHKHLSRLGAMRQTLKWDKHGGIRPFLHRMRANKRDDPSSLVTIVKRIGSVVRRSSFTSHASDTDNRDTDSTAGMGRTGQFPNEESGFRDDVRKQNDAEGMRSHLGTTAGTAGEVNTSGDIGPLPRDGSARFGMDPRQPSSSTFTASEISEAPNFELLRETSLKLQDLVEMESGSNHAINDGSDNQINNTSAFFWRSSRPPENSKRDFMQMQEQSMRFLDLVCMDIIPEADTGRRDSIGLDAVSEWEVGEESLLAQSELDMSDTMDPEPPAPIHMHRQPSRGNLGGLSGWWGKTKSGRWNKFGNFGSANEGDHNDAGNSDCEMGMTHRGDSGFRANCDRQAPKRANSGGLFSRMQGKASKEQQEHKRAFANLEAEMKRKVVTKSIPRQAMLRSINSMVIVEESEHASHWNDVGPSEFIGHRISEVSVDETVRRSNKAAEADECGNLEMYYSSTELSLPGEATDNLGSKLDLSNDDAAKLLEELSLQASTTLHEESSAGGEQDDAVLENVEESPGVHVDALSPLSSYVNPLSVDSSEPEPMHQPYDQSQNLDCKRLKDSIISGPLREIIAEDKERQDQLLSSHNETSNSQSIEPPRSNPQVGSDISDPNTPT